LSQYFIGSLPPNKNGKGQILDLYEIIDREVVGGIQSIIPTLESERDLSDLLNLGKNTLTYVKNNR